MVVAVAAKSKSCFRGFGFEDDGGLWRPLVDRTRRHKPVEFTKNSQYARSGNYALEAFFDHTLPTGPIRFGIERPQGCFPMRWVKIFFLVLLKSPCSGTQACRGTRPAKVSMISRCCHLGDQKWQVYQYEGTGAGPGRVLLAIGSNCNIPRFRGYIMISV